MSLEIQQQKLSDLMSSAPEIPGLSADSIPEILVESKFKKQLDLASNPEEREEIKSKLVEYYKNEGREFIEEKIADIKNSVIQLTKGIAQVPVIISGIVATAAVPTSTAAAVPMFASLLSFLEGLKSTCVTLLKSATALGFVLPAPIFALVSTVEGLFSLIPSKK